MDIPIPVRAWHCADVNVASARYCLCWSVRVGRLRATRKLTCEVLNDPLAHNGSSKPRTPCSCCWHCTRRIGRVDDGSYAPVRTVGAALVAASARAQAELDTRLNLTTPRTSNLPAASIVLEAVVNGSVVPVNATSRVSIQVRVHWSTQWTDVCNLSSLQPRDPEAQGVGTTVTIATRVPCTVCLCNSKLTTSVTLENSRLSTGDKKGRGCSLHACSTNAP